MDVCIGMTRLGLQELRSKRENAILLRIFANLKIDAFAYRRTEFSSIYQPGRLVQMVACFVRIEEVTGSMPVVSILF